MCAGPQRGLGVWMLTFRFAPRIIRATVFGPIDRARRRGPLSPCHEIHPCVPWSPFHEICSCAPSNAFHATD